MAPFEEFQSKHSDLLSATTKILNNLPIKINAQHVRGHQDEHTPYDMLPRIAQLNVKVDIRAKLQLQTCLDEKINPITFTPHYSSFPKITANKQIIREKAKTTIYNIIADKKILKIWNERERITEETKKQINWKAQENAMSSSSLGHKRFICKWVSDITATGKNMTRWKMRYEGQCPLFCYVPNEDRDHILRCMVEDAKEIWDKALREFKTTLTKYQTKPTLLNAIIKELDHWRKRTTTNISSCLN